jgi:F-type H+-transporting ATPase subunit delta
MANRITPHQYAVSLYDSAKALGVSKIPEIIARLISILRKNNDLALLKRVINELGYRPRAEILSARVLSEQTRQKISKILHKIELKERVDPALIGGLTIKVGDTLIDASLRNRLEKLWQKIS